MKQQREHWGSRLGFIMAAAGSAIGLGSLWRFPYIAGQNGGGVFIILYLVFTFLLGLPLFMGELVIGRTTQRSAVQAFSELSGQKGNWKILGWLNVLTTFLILSFYSVVSGWCVNYALMSINHFTDGKTPQQIRSVFDTLYTAGDVNLFWLFIFVLINVGVVYGGIRKGIEYWTRILTPALLVMLAFLFFYAMSLNGFPEAVRYLFKPDFTKITGSAILDALGMALFTLSLGLGAILTYGSYMTPSEDIPKTATIVSIMTPAVSLVAALVLFPIIFTFGFPPQEGTGLVFKTLPVLFAQLPGSVVLCTLFFILLVFTALTSSISLFEVLAANLMEMLSWTRAKAVLIAASAVFLFGIPSALSGSSTLFPSWKLMYGKDFFETFNYVTSSWLLPIAAFFTTLFIGWFMDRARAKDEFLKGTAWNYLVGPWLFVLKWVAPVAIALIILQEGRIVDLNNVIKYCFSS